MKTNKHQTLLLIKGKGAAQALDVVHAFKYTLDVSLLFGASRPPRLAAKD